MGVGDGVLYFFVGDEPSHELILLFFFRRVLGSTNKIILHEGFIMIS